ncbi:unnamed protein product [Vitrella brassicaformis CCMP3155]|uniref:Uncharacterized protein n=1 Tax=Vitrella brassicaformis (strain CCMP3155) TaxID=1169540 RepID=A0A0G4EJ47_VITBC|nr:unnamed protein product [Vitrella brassicaformis CCMP3155]|eukprot:CEL96087.1 unnamed protein product [Vitrella brassicaformis CCMP3155]
MIKRPSGDAISPGDDQEDHVQPQPSDRAEGSHGSALRRDTEIFVDFSNPDICTPPPCSQGVQPGELTTEDEQAAVPHLSKSNDFNHQGAVREQAKPHLTHPTCSHSTTLPDISEEGPSLRAEEMAILIMKSEFEKAAGYPAAFEEFTSHLVYEPAVTNDGDTVYVREVVAGSRFSPEPFSQSLRRAITAVLFQAFFSLMMALPWVGILIAYWKSCQSESARVGIAVDYVRVSVMIVAAIVWMLLIVEGMHLRRLWARFRQTWIVFLLPSAAAFSYYFIVTVG